MFVFPEIAHLFKHFSCFGKHRRAEIMTFLKRGCPVLGKLLPGVWNAPDSQSCTHF
jgi:hypothetical protein